MSENFGTGVSYVSDPTGYNYDTVIFQKGKPPLDTELNLIQQIQNDLAHKRLDNLSSGWMSFKPVYTSTLYSNSFYTQNPSSAVPEYALVNGMPIHVANTATTEAYANLVELGAGPQTASQVNGVFLEVWRALLSPNSSVNKPDPVTAVDSIMKVHAVGTNTAWAVGEDGLVLNTENAGETWDTQLIDTKQTLRSVYFINSTIGWVVGDNGTLARTSSGGVRWTMLTSGYTQNFNGVYAASQQLAWLVGDSGLILKTTNGINWFDQLSGITANLRSLYFIDTQNGWVVGDGGTILRTYDAGVNWQAQASGVTSRLNSVYFYDSRTGFAVGDGGVLLSTSNGGVTWAAANSGVTVDLTDVTMAPALDEYVDGEDVTSQFTGSNKTCTLFHRPVTKGDGNGTTTNLPSAVTVTVDGVEVAVDVVDGPNGIIVLNVAPARCAAVKVYYWYKISTAIFRGKAWATGKSGTVLKSDDVGTTWVAQDPLTAYDIFSIYMANSTSGWIVGQFSKIRHTIDGATWVEQLPSILARQVQRVFSEGNVYSKIYLNDNSIHPDLGIETTKRVQVQYKIRIIRDVDPFSYPDAGLGSTSIVGLGPEDSGTDAFVNMGPTTGDYGLWRAKCNGTVDGYTYAIPMFFVGRRNSTDFNATNNTNGSSTSESIRPDLLTSENVVDTDILDVRRKVLVSSTSQLLGDNFDALLNNSLSTKFFRDTVGGDRYGSEVMQLDRITGSTLATVAATGLSSNVAIVPGVASVLAIDSLPSPNPYTISTSGVFHQDPAYYSAVYNSSDPLYNGKAVPGVFSGFGTDSLGFTFNAGAITKAQDPTLTSYDLGYITLQDSSVSLSRIPSEPKLVTNSSGDSTYFYKGVFEQETSGRVITQWDSSIAGYTNAAIAYPISSSDNSSLLCSPVEVHLYVRADSSNLSNLAIDSTAFRYSVKTVSKVTNITSGYSYKISNVISNTASVTITAETGYNFVNGSVYEVVGMAKTLVDEVNNGATVNFKQSEKKLSTFCVSEILTGTVNSGQAIITSSIGNILGVSSMERIPLLGESGIILPFCWVLTGTGDKVFPIRLVSVIDGTVVFGVYNWNGTPYVGTHTVTIQALTSQTSLYYTDAATDLLQVAYYYKAYQSVSDLPATLSLRIVEKPKDIIVSNLGTGGSLSDKEPFDLPLQNIPVNDATITSDNAFFNIEPLVFSSFSIDGGLAQMPAYEPGNLSGIIELSNPTQDTQGRFFYQTCSKDFVFRTEGLQTGAPRKIFNGALAQIVESSDTRLIRNEYVMVVFSRNDFMGTDNYIKYGDKSVIAIYRLPNRPITRNL